MSFSKFIALIQSSVSLPGRNVARRTIRRRTIAQSLAPQNETLELRLLLSEPSQLGTIPQVVYLDFDGAENVTYRGPIVVHGINVPQFTAAHVGLGGSEKNVIAEVLQNLGKDFSSADVEFTTIQPGMSAYSTVFIGGTDSWLKGSERFFGISETVDTGNLSHSDNAFVFSDLLNAVSANLKSFSDNLRMVIKHEVSHLLGIGHSVQPSVPGIDDVAYSQDVHRWVTDQGANLFSNQFGKTAMAGDGNMQFAQGAFDEDAMFSNPFGLVGDAFPYLRHFWQHGTAVDATGAFVRDIGTEEHPTGGTFLSTTYESAPFRAEQYLTGSGFGGTGATAGFSEDPEAAFGLLGRIAHLLEDMALPAHSHADSHYESPTLALEYATFGVFEDPDPLHDFIDGKRFSTSALPTNLQVAQFDLAEDPGRFTSWTVNSDASKSLRSGYDLDPEFEPSAIAPDLDPLESLFTETANLSSKYDSKDVDGWFDQGKRRGPVPSLYSSWRLDELQGLAQELVQHSITDSAELIRYFFGNVDTMKPTAVFPEFKGSTADSPAIVTSTSFRVTAMATDQDTGDSGIGKDLFKFQYQVKGPGQTDFSPLMDPTPQNFVMDANNDLVLNSLHFDDGASVDPDFASKHGALAQPVFRGEIGSTYHFQVTVEDGAGNTKTSDAWVKVGSAGVVAGPTFILDFKDATQGVSSDRDGNTVSNFDVTQFGFRADQFYDLSNAIFGEVNDDYFGELNSTVFKTSGQELNVNFMVGDIGSPPPPGVSEYYYVQIGSAVAGSVKTGNLLGKALSSFSGGPAVRDIYGHHPGEITTGSVVATICTDNIQKGLQSVLTPGDWRETVNAISSTISHEIGHTLGLTHIDYSTSTQPTNVPPLMGTGAGPDPMPKRAQTEDQSFSISGFDSEANDGALFEQIDQLVRSLGLRSASPETVATLVEDEVDGAGIGFGSAGSGPYGDGIVNVGGIVYFSADDDIHGRELWRIKNNGIAESVGTSGSSHEIAPGPDGSSPTDLTVVGNTLFFSAKTKFNGTFQLWRINADGNAEIVLGLGSGLFYPRVDAVFGDNLYVTATDGNGNSDPTRLFQVSSTGQATYFDIPADHFAFGSIDDPSVVNNILYFDSDKSEASPDGLWRINGSGVAEPVSTGGTWSDRRFNFVWAFVKDVGSVPYFIAMSLRENEEQLLWRVNGSGVEMIHFDGVAAGTVVNDFREFIEVGGTLFFTATDGINGTELWRLNASGHAEMVDDSASGRGIVPGNGAGGVNSLTNVNGTLYFVALDGAYHPQLWRVSSTGIAEVVDDGIPGKGYSSPKSLTVVGDTLYFVSSSWELWRINSKGLAEGVPAYLGGFTGAIDDLTVSDGTLYFFAYKNGRQVWKVNQFGIIDRVEAIESGEPLQGGTSGFADLVDVDGQLFIRASFSGSGAGEEWWRIQNAQVAPPVITGFDTLVTYTAKGANTVLDADVTVTDSDSEDFAGGTLVVSTITNGEADDRFGIRNVGTAANQIGVSGDTVLFSGTSIGTFTGTTTLTVTFNANATPAAAQELLRNITFFSLSENPSILDRTVVVTLTDGDGGTSDSPTKTVKVAATTVTLSVSATTISENAGVATFKATLSSPAPAGGVRVTLGFSGNATNSADYTQSGTQIVIAAGQTEGTVTVTAIADAVVDPDEKITVTITSAPGATIAGTPVTVTIAEALPTAPLDIDGSGGSANGQSDGLMVFAILGGAGSDDVLNALKLGSLSSQEIQGKVAALGKALDVDGNGTVSGQSDGLLIFAILGGSDSDAVINLLKLGNRSPQQIRNAVSALKNPPVSPSAVSETVSALSAVVTDYAASAVGIPSINSSPKLFQFDDLFRTIEDDPFLLEI